MVGLTLDRQDMSGNQLDFTIFEQLGEDDLDGDGKPLILDEAVINNGTNKEVLDTVQEIRDESVLNENSSHEEQLLSCQPESSQSGCSSVSSNKQESRKRKKERKSPTNLKKLKLSVDGGKNPVSLLNEMFPGLIFNLMSSEGPSHDPIFTISVNVNGVEYVGRGKNKKDAKRLAAESVLSFMTQADSCAISYDPSQPVVEPSKPQKRMLLGTVNPISLLLEKRSDCLFDVINESGSNHPKSFCVKVEVDGKEFKGTGSSKKKAKAAAAHAALSDLHPELLSMCSVTATSSSVYTLNQVIADAIFYQMTKAAEELFSEVNLRYKVLSGIAMGWKANPTSLTTISLTTGTKCIKGDQLNYEGKAVYDCHAEILARRSLLVYLYDQLEKVLSKESSILVYNSATKLYRVNPSVQFHLFINTMPCGDGRAFSPHSADADNHPNRASRSKLRVKLESGEGTIPVPNNVTQTFDGIVGGEPLLTMSCSDKIAKWNVLGLQGSLLSHFLEPVYLSSVVCCQMTHAAHLERALFKRMHGVLLPSDRPFHVNEHLLGFPSLQKSRVVQKAVNQSINWNCVDGNLEFLDTVTGTTTNQTPSRLCKRALFKHFCKLFNVVNNSSTDSMALSSMTYKWAKESADKYQECLKRVLTEVTNRGFGHWVKKPAELAFFSLSEEELTSQGMILDSQAVNPSHHLQH